MKTQKLLILVIGLMFTSISALELPALFVDNMVLQQNTTVKIWGKSNADSKITIETDWGVKASSTSAKNGKWVCDLRTPSAGGPYTLSISDSESMQKIKNVLIGEVWFCSGQSNMEMPVQGWPPNDPILNSEEEIKQANYPDIRLFTVLHNASLSLQNNVTGNWQECNPQNIKTFSATAYFFARKLYKELNIPIGLIHSSWGGTPAQAWMNKKYLQKYADFKTIIDQIDSSKDKVAELKLWLNNLEQFSVTQANDQNKWSELDFKDNGVENIDFDASKWRTTKLPQLWEESPIGPFDGVIWFRKKIDLADLANGQNVILELGPVDDMDITFFNGTEVGRVMQEGLWQAKRKYKIPAELVNNGENTIAVKVIDNQGGGGIYGAVQDMKIYSEDNTTNVISLAGEWKYLPIAEYKNGRFYLFDISDQQYYQRPKVAVEDNPNIPTTLFNGMVHPVVPYTIKGAIWYQGESNAGNPEQYEQLFPDLIKNWREVWGIGNFPFYFTQIAPYNYGDETESHKLRDAQRKSLSLENTGMAVTLDIGNPDNIHPANKQDVGKRLALWALAKTYNKNVVFSGPLYKSLEIKGDKAIISFTHVGKGLRIKKAAIKNFLIAGKDKKFKEVTPAIEKDRIVISHPDITKPVAVRYLWDNTSEATLFNLDGLPASSFRTDNW